jgi:hypothetical protein
MMGHFQAKFSGSLEPETVQLAKGCPWHQNLCGEISRISSDPGITSWEVVEWLAGRWLLCFFSSGEAPDQLAMQGEGRGDLVPLTVGSMEQPSGNGLSVWAFGKCWGVHWGSKGIQAPPFSEGLQLSCPSPLVSV